MRLPFLTALFFACSCFLYAEPEDGLWENSDNDGRIRITVVGGELKAQIAWAKNPSSDFDIHNPNKALRKRPLIGLPITKGLRKKGDSYKGGTIYDPKSGKTYKATVKLDKGGKTLSMRGFIGISLLGRSETFTRVDEKAAPATKPAPASAP